MFLKRCLIATSIIFFAFFMSISNAMAETWKITSLDWQPYSGSNMGNKGNSVLKLRNLLKKKGITLIVEFYPWKRAQYLAKQKGYVGYFPAWPEEVAAGFIGSKPVDWSYLGALTYKGSNVTWKNIDYLFRNYKVGIVQTYVYPVQVRRAIKKYRQNVDYAPDETALLRKLSAKRHHVALTDPSVMMYLARQKRIRNIIILKKKIQIKPLVVSFRKGADNTRRLKILNRLLK